MNSKIYSITNSKKAQNLLFSYMFYLVVSLPILLATFFFTNALITEVEDVEDYMIFKHENNMFLQNFLRAYEQPGAIINFNNTQNYINSQSVLRTTNEFSSFQSQEFTYFYKHQIPFCENYVIALMNIQHVQIDTSSNCMIVQRKISLFDEFE